jgi:hypothetical protein
MTTIYLLLAIILGSVVTTVVDKLLGIKWEEYPPWKHVLNKLVHMSWGAILYSIGR